MMVIGHIHSPGTSHRVIGILMTTSPPVTNVFISTSISKTVISSELPLSLSSSATAVETANRSLSSLRTMVASCVISTSVRWKIDVWRQHETLRPCHVYVNCRSSWHNTVDHVHPDGQRQLQAAHVHRPSTVTAPVISTVVTSTSLPHRELPPADRPVRPPCHAMFQLWHTEGRRANAARRRKNRRTLNEAGRPKD